MNTSLWPADYPVDPHHCADVLNGAYDVPVNMPSPVILDIGANIGAFARWASVRWPAAKIHCYEPQPQNFKLLLRTVTELIDHPENVTCHEVAVLDKPGNFRLYAGKYNCGEWTLYGNATTDRNNYVNVPVMDAKDLPTADILKIDTEGAEPFILNRLVIAGRIREFKAIMLEFHRTGEGTTLEELLAPCGFRLFANRPGLSPSRGELKFLRID
jgi:FkbM family methyltransferase